MFLTKNLKDYWLPEIENQNRSDAKIFVVGNKSDLPKREVESYSVENLLSSHKVEKTFEVSAKNATNI